MTDFRFSGCRKTVGTLIHVFLSLPEMINENSTFRAKALCQEVSGGAFVETSNFPLSFQVVRESTAFAYDCTRAKEFLNIFF